MRNSIIVLIVGFIFGVPFSLAGSRPERRSVCCKPYFSIGIEAISGFFKGLSKEIKWRNTSHREVHQVYTGWDELNVYVHLDWMGGEREGGDPNFGCRMNPVDNDAWFKGCTVSIESALDGAVLSRLNVNDNLVKGGTSGHKGPNGEPPESKFLRFGVMRVRPVDQNGTMLPEGYYFLVLDCDLTELSKSVRQPKADCVPDNFYSIYGHSVAIEVIKPKTDPERAKEAMKKAMRAGSDLKLRIKHLEDAFRFDPEVSRLSLVEAYIRDRTPDKARRILDSCLIQKPFNRSCFYYRDILDHPEKAPVWLKPILTNSDAGNPGTVPK